MSALNQGESGAEMWGWGREAFAIWASGRHMGFTRGERVECRLGLGDPAGPLCSRGYSPESPVLSCCHFFLVYWTVDGATADAEQTGRRRTIFRCVGASGDLCRAPSCARVGEGCLCSERRWCRVWRCRGGVQGRGEGLVPCARLTRALPVCLLRAGVREEAAHGADLRHLDAL